MANPILTIVIPVFNEADVLPAFLPEIEEYAQSNDFVLIFVDDASTDESAKLLAAFCQQSKSTLLRHKVNRGYGGALKTGIKACQTEYVVTMDADGQHQPVDAGRLLEFGLAKGADMVVGRRQSGNSGLYRAIGRKMIRLLAGTLVSLPIEDLNSGMKLYRTRLAQGYLVLCPDGMSFSDIITLVFVHRNNLVLEHDINVRAGRGAKARLAHVPRSKRCLKFLISSLCLIRAGYFYHWAQDLFFSVSFGDFRSLFGTRGSPLGPCYCLCSD